MAEQLHLTSQRKIKEEEAPGPWPPNQVLPFGSPMLSNHTAHLLVAHATVFGTLTCPQSLALNSIRSQASQFYLQEPINASFVWTAPRLYLLNAAPSLPPLPIWPPFKPQLPTGNPRPRIMPNRIQNVPGLFAHLDEESGSRTGYASLPHSGSSVLIGLISCLFLHPLGHLAILSPRPLYILWSLYRKWGLCLFSPGPEPNRMESVYNSKARPENAMPCPPVSWNACSPSSRPPWSSPHTLGHSAVRKPTLAHMEMA